MIMNFKNQKVSYAITKKNYFPSPRRNCCNKGKIYLLFRSNKWMKTPLDAPCLRPEVVKLSSHMSPKIIVIIHYKQMYYS